MTFKLLMVRRQSPTWNQAALRGTSRMTERIRALGGSVRWLYEKDAAELLGVPLATFHKNWRRWGVPGYKLGGRVKDRSLPGSFASLWT